MILHSEGVPALDHSGEQWLIRGLARVTIEKARNDDR